MTSDARSLRGRCARVRELPEDAQQADTVDEPARTRLVGALLPEQSDEWSLQRRYMQLEGLQSLADNRPARLSAVIDRAGVELARTHDSYTTLRDTINAMAAAGFLLDRFPVPLWRDRVAAFIHNAPIDPAAVVAPLVLGYAERALSEADVLLKNGDLAIVRLGVYLLHAVLGAQLRIANPGPLS